MFQTILKHFLGAFEGGVIAQINDLVDSTMVIYENVGA
jgi:hypothetical protein